ncbi:hypothetical protein BDV40DRAFT_297548 [Aspergillus tamarii]|uniref:C2H2-type domain-containing protein n=1 Tax=Aspergillus tamarii TaxID=41984 RepID=A0A5N6V6H4_ASPTM|nr:hypothetical protein BDV40DRAFT_297548 [Aspergillus tamarii]
MDHHPLPHRPESPSLSTVGTLSPILVDPFDLLGRPANTDPFDTVGASVALPEDVHTEPDPNPIFANGELLFPHGDIMNYTFSNTLDPTASYPSGGTSASQSVPLNGETSLFTEDYIHGDSYTAPCPKIPSPSTITGNGRELLQTRQAPFSTDFLEGQRSLPRRRSKYMINKYENQAVPMFIPTSTSIPDPLRRWQESPPEDEPAPLSAIRDAVQHSWSKRPAYQGIAAVEHQQSISDPGFVDAFQTYRQSGSQAASTTSAESGVTSSSRQSARSGRSSGSHESSRNKTNDRVRKTKPRGKKDKSATKDSPRLFCCTFCCDRFKSKYDWMRHEKSLHLNLETWVCTPFGGAVVLPSTGRVHCAYCSMLDPTAEHLTQHNHGACDGQQRKFRRKDHLVQHLRLVHRIDTLPIINDWKVEATNFTSRCGFCARQMTTWSQRCDHLALHFRNGSTMADWQGDHGFPESIAAQITHAVPPYLIDLESRTMVPFSATNSHAKDHFSQMLSRAAFQSDTNVGSGNHQERSELPGLLGHLQLQDSGFNSYTQVLTRHLSHYAEEQTRLGIVPTDEMFQREARRLMFDSEDPWNQTIADHPQWLAAFREEQGSFTA